MLPLPQRTSELIVVGLGNQFQLMEGFSFSHTPVAPNSVRGNFLGETKKKLTGALKNFTWMLSSAFPQSAIIKTVERRMWEPLWVAGPVDITTTHHFMSLVPNEDRRSVYRCHVCGHQDDKARVSSHVAVVHWAMRIKCSSSHCPAFVPALKSGKNQPCVACSHT